MPSSDPTPLARALGRIPSGLFVVTASAPDGPVGFVASFVQQVGFEPPTVCVAVGTGRGPLEAMRAAGSFAISVLDPASEKLMGRFFKKHGPGESPFDGLEVTAAPGGAPVLSGALAWLDCRIVGEQALADHVVLFGEVTGGALAREGDPSVHLRRNGLSY